MPDENTKPEPQNFGDLTMRPTGSGSADLETSYLEAALDGAAADASVEAGVADETAAYDKAMSPTEGTRAEDESEGRPS